MCFGRENVGYWQGSCGKILNFSRIEWNIVERLEVETALVAKLVVFYFIYTKF
jgi:hypothetical protein